MDAGADIPDRVWRAVDVWPHLEDYARAFHVLSGKRQWIAGGLGPSSPGGISEVELAAYARNRVGIVGPSREYDRFCRLVDAQDQVFLAHHARMIKNALAKDGGTFEPAPTETETEDED